MLTVQIACTIAALSHLHPAAEEAVPNVQELRSSLMGHLVGCVMQASASVHIMLIKQGEEVLCPLRRILFSPRLSCSVPQSAQFFVSWSAFSDMGAHTNQRTGAAWGHWIPRRPCQDRRPRWGTAWEEGLGVEGKCSRTGGTRSPGEMLSHLKPPATPLCQARPKDLRHTRAGVHLALSLWASFPSFRQVCRDLLDFYSSVQAHISKWLWSYGISLRLTPTALIHICFKNTRWSDIFTKK